MQAVVIIAAIIAILATLAYWQVLVAFGAVVLLFVGLGSLTARNDEAAKRTSRVTTGLVCVALATAGGAVTWPGMVRPELQSIAASGASAPTPSDAPSQADSAASDTIAASPSATAVNLAKFSGVSLTTAMDRLSTSGAEFELEDLSPRNRPVTGAATEWVVATASHDQAGTVVLFVLRPPELQWFQANPTMPQLPLDAETSSLTAPGGVLEGVSELIEYRWQEGTALSDSTPIPSRDVKRVSPAIEPEQEVKDRSSLPVSEGIGIVAGSRPSAHAAVRPGRLVVVIERPAPQPTPEPRESENDDSKDVVVVPGDEDNDENRERKPATWGDVEGSDSDEPAARYFKSCDAARRAGAAPLYADDPGYRSGLDRDKDGVACE